MSFLERFKGEIYLLYKIEKKELEYVQAIIFDRHGVDGSDKQYNDKLAEWGFRKYNNKTVTHAALHTLRQHQLAGEDVELYFLQQPMNIRNLKESARRMRIAVPDNTITSRSQQLPIDGLVARKLPHPTRILQAPEQFVMHKLVHDVDILVRGSFESGKWRFLDNERLIESSTEAPVEKRKLMHFLGNIDVGCRAAQNLNQERANEYFELASIEIRDLIRGAYHDIIPNLITKLNDLNNRGFPVVAKNIMVQISQLCLQQQDPRYPISLILANIHAIPLDYLSWVEDQIMIAFDSIFEVYLGTWCYNTFVARMNKLRRMLDRDESVDLDQCLTDLLFLDKVYVLLHDRSMNILRVLDTRHGPLNCRSLDILRIRIETLFRRYQYQQVIDETLLLRQRAEQKHNDPWQRHYFLIKALYFGGSAHFYLENLESAKHNFEYALNLEEEFCQIDRNDHFDSEKLFMLDCLISITQREVSVPPSKVSDSRLE